MGDLTIGRGEQTDGRGGEQRAEVPRAYSRRLLLRAALGAAGAAALAACGGESPATTPATGTTPTAGGGTTPTATGAAARPATTATTARATTTTAATTARTTAAAPTARATAAASPVAVEGKIPSPAPGVPDAYTKLPPPFKAIPTVPGRGGKVSYFQIQFRNPVPPREQNQYWQELEKRLGVTLEPTWAPSANYTEKLATLTAGGDLPDMVFLWGPPADQLRVIQQGAYADLTPYLTGDALQEFPSLAAFPPQVWKNLAIRGKIYGVPRPNFLQGGGWRFRQDWVDKVGLAPKNAEEFFRLMTAFTKGDPDGNGQPDTFGITSAATASFALSVFQMMFRAPNGWRKNPDGTLTNTIETEEFKGAIAYMRRLFEAGLYHPDTAALTDTQVATLLDGGKVGGDPGSMNAGFFVGEVNAQKVNPAARYGLRALFGHDGGNGVSYNGSGYFGYTTIPTRVGRDRERVKELLRLLNYWAAPFGSEEQVFLQWGIEGVHYTKQPDGTLVRTDPLATPIGDFPFLTTNPPVAYYVPGDSVFAQNALKEIAAIGIDSPVLGLYSATTIARGNELQQLGRDRVAEIVQGRQPLSAVDGYIQEWKSRGGDQIRKEFEEELKAQ